MRTTANCRRMIAVFSLFAATALAAACGSASNPSTPTPTPTPPSGPSAPTTVRVTISGAPDTPATSFQLTATAQSSDGSTQDVTRTAAWESSNASVATVSAGLVSVMSDGEVDIRATFQGTTGSTHVRLSTPKAFTLTGFVVDAATNHGLAGVRVQLIGGTSTQTDANGAFGLAVKQGRVLVEFSKTGYETFERDVTISGDTQLLVSLKPRSTS